MSNPPATVDEYVSTLEPWQREVAERLRSVVSAAAPEASQAIKWRQPVFVLNGNMCYLSAFTGHLNFGFFRGTDIPDPEGLLEGTAFHAAHRHSEGRSAAGCRSAGDGPGRGGAAEAALAVLKWRLR